MIQNSIILPHFDIDVALSVRPPGIGYILWYYSGTSIILDTALMLAYQISEIIRITEVLTFLTEFMVPNLLNDICIV